MALINCPECGKQISDKAPACIHCGYPIQTEQVISTSISNSKKVAIPSFSEFSQQKFQQSKLFVK